MKLSRSGLFIYLKKRCRDIVSFLFPRGCLACDRLLTKEPLICSNCQLMFEKLLITVDERCPKCSRPSKSSKICDCCDLRKELYLFSRVEALFLYQDEIRVMLIKFKLHGYLHLGELWAELLYDQAMASIDEGYVIVPTPSNRRHSSFNAINYYLGKKTDQINHCLYKRRGVAQKNLGGDERLAAIKGRIYSKGVVPRKVLLIDDIFTTGATLSECTKILKEKGAEEVRAVVIAITPTG